MTLKEFTREIQKKRKELDELVRHRLPVVVGRMAKDHYQDNFRKGGFVNNGLQKWEPAKRLTSGSSRASAKYGTLLSSRNHLFSSIKSTPGDYGVKVSNDVPYAAAHQYGETMQATVTDKMRRFAWAKYYEAGGGSKSGGEGVKKPDTINSDAEFWKRLALTKKTKLSIKMPARPFIGESAELTQKIRNKGDAEIRKILNI